jgi:hypothetical protein
VSWPSPRRIRRDFAYRRTRACASLKAGTRRMRLERGNLPSSIEVRLAAGPVRVPLLGRLQVQALIAANVLEYATRRTLGFGNILF